MTTDIAHLRRLLAEAPLGLVTYGMPLSDCGSFTDRWIKIGVQIEQGEAETAVVAKRTGLAALIAAAVNALPGLLDELEATKAECEAAHATAHDAVSVVEKASASAFQTACEDAASAVNEMRIERDALKVEVERLRAALGRSEEAVRMAVDTARTERDFATARVARLETALRQFSEHEDHCGKWHECDEKLVDERACTCGLDAFLAEAASA